MTPERLIFSLDERFIANDGVRRSLSMVKVGKRAVVIGVARVVTPLGLVGLLLLKLHILFGDAIRRSFAVVEVRERPVVVRIARVVAPFRFVLFVVLLRELDSHGGRQHGSLNHL